MLASENSSYMIDNIKIYFPANHFKGNFSNCILNEKKETRNEWRLYNPQNNSHISIWEHNNGAVTIKGSLRKWQFGKSNISDLTLSTFIQATKQVAELLDLSWNYFSDTATTQIEFGFNIPISIPYSQLSRKIVSYATFRTNKIRGKGRTKGNYGTIYFGERESDFRLKIYDKCKEIEDKADFTDDITTSNFSSNIMRIEFIADDKDALKRKGLPKVACINDLINHWEKLRELWAYEVGRITIQSVISDTTDFSLNECLCVESLNLYPWKDNIKIYEEYIEEHYKTKASVNSAKTKLYTRINYLLDNHSDKNDYRKIDLYRDIMRYFIDLKANGENINLVRIIAMLNAHTSYAGLER